jgi:hypothetical protein
MTVIIWLMHTDMASTQRRSCGGGGGNGAAALDDKNSILNFKNLMSYLQNTLLFYFCGAKAQL